MSAGRRERKSRDALQRALIGLMRGKRVEKITITELCALADVNRSTFYAHYNTVEQLLSEIHEELFDEMDRCLGFNSDSRPLPHTRAGREVLTEVLNYMCGERFLFFLSNNDSHLLERNLSRHYTEKFCDATAPLERRYALYYHTTGCFLLIRQWISEGCPCSADSLARQLVQLSASGEAASGRIHTVHP